MILISFLVTKSMVKLSLFLFRITFEITDWKTEKSKMLISNHSHSRYFFIEMICYKIQNISKEYRQA